MKVIVTPEFKKSLNRMIWRERTLRFNPMEYRRQIRWFWQRGRRGYSDADLWNACDHIASTAIAFLELDVTGVPYGLSEKKWEEYRQEMLWMFRQHSERDETPVETQLSESYKKRMKRASKIFGEYWPALWN